MPTMIEENKIKEEIERLRAERNAYADSFDKCATNEWTLLKERNEARAEIERLRGRLKVARDAVEFYADNTRWCQRDVYASGTELACGPGKCLEPIQAGTKIGTQWVPSGRTQIDHGKLAQETLALLDKGDV